jgi:tRNA threonylcarbamoyladenosine biosynthesis protein TsaE
MFERTEILMDEEATVAAGAELGRLLQPSTILFLEGQLGAGKTTFTRGVLNAFGYSGAVKSPTYTLVEPYETQGGKLYHFDLYRLGDPEELAFMGIRDYFDEQAICLVEWPERGSGFLPPPDIQLELHPEALDQGKIARRITMQAMTKKGEEILVKN